jgi:uncharacterized membrane protein
MLVAGVLLWSAVHLFTALAAGARQRLLDRYGRGPYRGIYSLLILASVVLMVLGWRGSAPVAAYAAPAGMHEATIALMLVAMVLFVAGRAPTDVRRVLRHPQLTGVALWGAAHLLSNGDSRSLVLFGGLGLWALVEMMLINRRDGAWERPEPFGSRRTAIATLIGVAAWIVLGLVHPWIAGVRVWYPS